MKHDFEIANFDSVRSFADASGLAINSIQYGRVLAAKTALMDVVVSNYGRHYANDVRIPLIAGGAISRIFRTDSSGGDVDVYCSIGRTLTDVMRRDGANVTHVGPTTIQVLYRDIPFNFILSTRNDPDITLNLFDLNIVRMAMLANSDTVYYHPKAITDLKTKTVSFSNCPLFLEALKLNPESTKLRLDKYEKLGYSLCIDDILNSTPIGDLEALDFDPDDLSEEEKYAVVYKNLELMQKHQQVLINKKSYNNMYVEAGIMIQRYPVTMSTGERLNQVAIAHGFAELYRGETPQLNPRAPIGYGYAEPTTATTVNMNGVPRNRYLQYAQATTAAAAEREVNYDYVVLRPGNFLPDQQ